jgi:hypothetical protein
VSTVNFSESFVEGKQCAATFFKIRFSLKKLAPSTRKKNKKTGNYSKLSNKAPLENPNILFSIRKYRSKSVHLTV